MNNQSSQLKIKEILLLVFFISIWGIIFVKTLLVSVYEPDSFFSPFYSIMLENTWQSHFNVDLFLFTLLFAAWTVYKERSLLIGIIIGLFSILFGGVFAFLYLIICLVRSKGNLNLFLNGKNTSL